MGVSSSESHDLTAFYELLTASFGVLSQNTGFYPSLDRIVETMLGPWNLGPGGGSYNELISRLQRAFFGSSPPTWGCHPPPSTGHTSLSLSINHPGVFSGPHHSTTTPDDFKVNFCTRSHACTRFWANNPPVPSTIDFPGDFRCTPLPLPTSLSISINLLFTHSWGAVKNPVRLGCNIPIQFLVDFCRHFCSPWLGSHYNTFLWGAHATCTACLPHSNHFFAGLCLHSVHPWLRSHYNTHRLGPILLALYACPTSTTPADFILALHSSTARAPVKTPPIFPFTAPLPFPPPPL